MVNFRAYSAYAVFYMYMMGFIYSLKTSKSGSKFVLSQKHFQYYQKRIRTFSSTEITVDDAETSHIPVETSLNSGADRYFGNSIENGHVYFVATPIGNRYDITKRAIDVLTNVDVIYAEDTRNTKNLLKLLNITYKNIILSHHEYNWKEVIPKLLNYIRNDNYSIAVVSDAGSPCISDPGYQLANECFMSNIPVHPIPGPSSVISALTVSGFPSTIFTFLGFIPSKGKERTTVLNQIQSLSHTVVFFESPHRVLNTMEEIANTYKMSNRPCLCCREMTKLYEEFKRGTIEEIHYWLQKTVDSDQRIKGEFTIVLGPYEGHSDALKEKSSDLNSILHTLTQLKNDNIKRSEAVKLVTEMYKSKGLVKSVVYKIALDIEDW